ncbi:hypothetical protein GGS24DRAFT_476600 [Hypoxylon argillaceum]|nr:hypothetical protein GGS24DRAFT_476600 [Hypoxylon argillaceum]KAI1147576.1 hypothetical protein F4825DRAFT_436969 [Nemania diffusa]
MSRLILDHATVILKSSVVKNTLPIRITGWSFESVNDTPRACQSNEAHSKLNRATTKFSTLGNRIQNWRI